MADERVHRERVPGTETPLLPRERGCQVPLTSSQMGLWENAREQMGGLSDQTCFVARRITGPLNVSALHEALDAVVERHEALRTSIVQMDGVPTQHVDRARKCPYELLRVSDVSQVLRVGASFVREPVNLATDPLFAARLYRLSPREHILILTVDHIITDGFSNNVLYRDLWAVYRELTECQRSLLPSLSLHFPDYAVWQHQNYGNWMARHEGYWRGRLGSARPVQLPLEAPSSQLPLPGGAALEVPFGLALSHDLQKLARGQNALPPLLFLTLYVAVLSRWCSQTDMVIAFATSARHRPELQHIVGFVANALHLRIELAPGETFLSLLAKVHLEFRTANAHQDFGRVPSLVPECKTDVLFNWLPKRVASDRSPVYLLEANDLEVEPFPLEIDWWAESVKLALFFQESDSGVCVTMRYRSDLFSRKTIGWLGDSLVSVARLFLERPYAQVSSSGLDSIAPSDCPGEARHESVGHR